MSVIIIAEIGENHLGNMEIAKMLIEKSAEAGVDYVKFQSYRPETFNSDDPEYDWFKKVSLSNEDHFMLKEYAEKFSVKFLTSPFNIERAMFLCEELKLKEIKIASGMMMNVPVLDYVNDRADTVFLSTGMATIPEIKEAISHLNNVNKLYILHCVTQYPCKDEDANLLAIRKLHKKFPEYNVGYSDHTIGYTAPIAAAALGANVIEKHFTFDKNAKEGTDHILSVDSDELKDMVSQIRKIENLLGIPEKTPTEEEKKIIEFVRNRFIS